MPPLSPTAIDVLKVARNDTRIYSPILSEYLPLVKRFHYFLSLCELKWITHLRAEGISKSAEDEDRGNCGKIVATPLDEMDAVPDTDEGNELELLVTLVEFYEEKKYAIDLPDAVSAIKFRMEQQGLKQKDLIPFIGSPSKVSEVLSGRRGLSIAMIRNLADGLAIPADVLIGRHRSRRASAAASFYVDLAALAHA